VITPGESTQSRKFQFGDFHLDVRDHTLKRLGRTIPLRPKSFETLAYLVEHHGRLVTKDELLTTLWAGVVVTEGTLTHCIEEIRDAVGDDPHHPRFLQTIPRVGYRFIGEMLSTAEETTNEEVEESEYTALKVKFRDGSMADIDTTAPARNEPLFRPQLGVLQRVALTIGIVGLLLAAAAGAFWYLHRDRSEIITSVAVLPFDNLSGNPEEEYFADGLTDALISELAGIRKLRVISRTSVMQYRANRKPLPQIGSELLVDAVVEGSVFRSGDRVRTTAALITAASEHRIWGETFERDQRDMLALIREMARTIAGEINIELTSTEQANLASGTSVEMPAYELYLKGRYHWNKRTSDGFRKGIDCFQRALNADSQYAPAFVGLADCYNMLGDYDLLPPKMAFPTGRAASLRAIALDSSLADAHASLAFAAMRFDWNWPEVEKEYIRAIGLNPSCSNAHHWYALYLATRGRFAEAKEEIRKAQILDPLSTIILANLAWVLYFTRENDQAIAVCREVLQRDSTFVSAHIKLGWSYEQHRLYREAQTEFEKAIASGGDDPALLSMLARAYALQNERGKAIALINRVIDQSSRLYVSGYHVAAAYVGLGEKTRALEWLRKSYDERSGWLAWLNVDPKFDDLRGDPRFVALLDSLKLR